MSRTKRLILVAIAAATLAVGAAGPALADKGGQPHMASCGYGQSPPAQANRLDPLKPGNGEASQQPPVGCKGRA